MPAVLAYMYMHNGGWGWSVLMTLGWLALLAVIVVVVASLRDRRTPSAKEILDGRLAAGEIDIDEYLRVCDALDAGDGKHPAREHVRHGGA